MTIGKSCQSFTWTGCRSHLAFLLLLRLIIFPREQWVICPYELAKCLPMNCASHAVYLQKHAGVWEKKSLMPWPDVFFVCHSVPICLLQQCLGLPTMAKLIKISFYGRKFQSLLSLADTPLICIINAQQSCQPQMTFNHLSKASIDLKHL